MRARRWQGLSSLAKGGALALAFAGLAGSAAASAALAPPPPPVPSVAPQPTPRPPAQPYRLWWSFPADHAAAIEIDAPDLEASPFASRWQLARELERCDPEKSARKVARAGLGSVSRLREVRIEQLDAAGEVRSVTRCVLSLSHWRRRFGKRLVERLDDELDAHESFLHPRKHPGPAPLPTPDRDRPAR